MADTFPHEIAYEEDHPPHYSENGHEPRSQSDVHITIAPLPENNTFQVTESRESESGVHALKSTICGEVQIKLPGSQYDGRRNENLTITLIGIEAISASLNYESNATALGEEQSSQRQWTHQRQVVNVSQEVWPPSTSPPYTERNQSDHETFSSMQGTEPDPMPSIIQFKLPLPCDLSSCIHFRSSKLEYMLFAHYQCLLPSDSSVTPMIATGKQLIHIVQPSLDRLDFTSACAPLVEHYMRPLPMTIFVPSRCVVQGSDVRIYITVPINNMNPEYRKSLPQLRRATASLVRRSTIFVLGSHNPSGIISYSTTPGSPSSPSQPVSTPRNFDEPSTSGSGNWLSASEEKALLNTLDSGDGFAERRGASDGEAVHILTDVLLRSGKSLRLPASSEDEDGRQNLPPALRLLLTLHLPRPDELCESHTMETLSGCHRIQFLLRVTVEAMNGQEAALEEEIVILPSNARLLEGWKQIQSPLSNRLTSNGMPMSFAPSEEYDGYSQGIPPSTAAIWQEEANHLASDPSLEVNQQAIELQQDVLPEVPPPSLNSQDHSEDIAPPNFSTSQQDSESIGGHQAHLGSADEEGRSLSGFNVPNNAPVFGPPPYPLLEQMPSHHFISTYPSEGNIGRTLTSAPPYREN